MIRYTETGQEKEEFPDGFQAFFYDDQQQLVNTCLLYTSPSPRDRTRSRMPSSA